VQIGLESEEHITAPERDKKGMKKIFNCEIYFKINQLKYQ
jgi:hypothetical protein